MPSPFCLSLAATAGFSWINLFWVLLGIAVFLVALAAFGRYLANTHPDAQPVLTVAAPAAVPVVAAPSTSSELTPEIAVVLASTVHAMCGPSARITRIVPIQSSVSVDSLMLAWSLEGRREIYSSHRIR